MKKYSCHMFFLVWIFFCQKIQANLTQQCMLGIPIYKEPLVEEGNDLPVLLQAEHGVANYPSQLKLEGDVVVKQGNSTLSAEEVEVKQMQYRGKKQASRIAFAKGKLYYKDPSIELQGEEGVANLDTQDTDITPGNYQLVGRQGRGGAVKIQLRDKQKYILQQGNFTTCLPGDRSWQLKGSEIIYDQEEQLLEAWNARFSIADIPILYTPYMQFPVGNRRRSGLLIPSIKHSGHNGTEFLLPWYWNIAPNYDATITPHWISKRGLQWQNEGRYLMSLGSGTVALDWLPHDAAYKSSPSASKTRWLWHWEHSAMLHSAWRFDVNYTRVSDATYFSDFTSPYGLITDGYISQKVSLSHVEKDWDATLSARQYQLFVEGGNSYRAIPQLFFNYYEYKLGPFNAAVSGQMAKFVNTNPGYPQTYRWHLQPELRLPMTNNWGSLNTEIKLLATQYQQNIPSTMLSGEQLAKSVSRFIPLFKTDGKVIFERAINQENFLVNYKQTLEPRVQYLYIPYRNQDNIYIYDTALLQHDYFGLFRDTIYSGLDRIAAANQITAGVTSRFYDGVDERFNFSIGQIYRLSPSISGDKSALYQDRKRALSWAADSNWIINSALRFRSGVQYDTYLRKVTLGNAVIEYRRDSDRLLQLNYRYIDSHYLATLDQNYMPGQVQARYRQGISQVGIAASWPLFPQWATVGSYYYDAKFNQTANQTLGLQYNTCCWSVQLGYERNIIGWDTAKNMSQYDNKFILRFEIRGLNNNHSLGSRKLLAEGSLPFVSIF